MLSFFKAIFRPKAPVAKILFIFLVIGFLAMGFLGYLDALKALLDTDRMAFTIGERRISLYFLIWTTCAVVALIWLAGIVSDFFEKKIRKLGHVNASNRALTTKAFQIVIYFGASLFALDLIGVDLTTLTIFSGAVGIGLGFGLQKIASNFVSGIILLFEKSIEEEDLIELDDGTSGYVRRTNARYTLIETFECREIMIPNEDLITKRLTNWTFSNTKGRVDINIGVAYGSDLERVEQLILEAAKEHSRCSHDPAPECFLADFGESSIDFTLYFWVDDIVEGRKRPRSDVLFAIWRKFSENGIVIPYPQQDVHIHKAGD